MAAAEFSLPVRVYIEDTDAGGIVYYVNYLKFMERARTEYMRSLGFDREHIFNHNRMFVVRDVQLRYLQPARLDDLLQVTVEPERVGAALLQLRQVIRRDSAVLAQGRVDVVCVDRDTLTPSRLPTPLREQLQAAV
ncbi:MAG: tol-pal system-associated acyl-CoA thioesterase [Halieaceae bacterium]|nr:tol-pal system-associated acyl-CoA thioesterase [Halieaceae bacterium]